ncbi:MAG: plasmid mobilization relaxosome protein MobC, partial [Chitinophagaceae bacterium]|nr:plasmid mobilization relaxosome protein MobC [Chitinophagaceae bacterium]
KAAKAGLKLTTYIRQAAIYSEVKTRLTEDERTAVRQLIGLSNNINQVAKACHEEGILRAMQHFEQYRNQLDLILKKLHP